MDTKVEIKQDLKKITLLFGFLIGLGILLLILSTLLQLSGGFPNTPTLVFKLINGFSIGFIIVCGLVWSYMEKKTRMKTSAE